MLPWSVPHEGDDGRTGSLLCLFLGRWAPGETFRLDDFFNFVDAASFSRFSRSSLKPMLFAKSFPRPPGSMAFSGILAKTLKRDEVELM